MECGESEIGIVWIRGNLDIQLYNVPAGLESGRDIDCENFNIDSKTLIDERYLFSVRKAELFRVFLENHLLNFSQGRIKRYIFYQEPTDTTQFKITYLYQYFFVGIKGNGVFHSMKLDSKDLENIHYTLLMAAYGSDLKPMEDVFDWNGYNFILFNLAYDVSEIELLL